MGMNETPSAERVHIGIFGRRNAGKSSVMNAVTGQSLAIVSDRKGTTTDPVKKAMELLPLGPVVFVDTPGLDDEGELGRQRVEKSYQALEQTDLAALVIDGEGAAEPDALLRVERPLLKELAARRIPYVIAVNKADALTEQKKRAWEALFADEKNLLFVSAKSGEHIQDLKECLAKLRPEEIEKRRILGDLLQPGDVVALVVPIDSAAPKGRLILPQQQVIRDCLEVGAHPFVTRETELCAALSALSKKPKVVVTDSQAFERVAKDTPEDMFLTSFSILFSRYKGDLAQQVKGAKKLLALRDGDVILISEGCTHHRQCEDIGTVKMPRWIREYTGKDIQFAFTSGTQFPQDLSQYALIVHCGGCTLNERQMKSRLQCAVERGVPMTNYGMAIAQMHGVLDRSLALFRAEGG